MYAYTQYLYNLRGREEIERERSKMQKLFIASFESADTERNTKAARQAKEGELHTHI